MDNATPADAAPSLSALSDLILKYDMAKMIKETELEFEAVITSRELVDQDSIAQFFNLEGSSNAGN